VLDFWFFDDGYGGGVTIEGGQSNFCFLIKRDALAKHIEREGCVVTGPLAYDRLPGEFIAIGDAMGMLDPFCGEGMCHALDSGILAARAVAAGLRRRASYAEMKYQYEAEWERRWAVKRALGAAMRKAVWRSWPVAAAMRVAPVAVMKLLWGAREDPL
jgi:flavin-dependent dehydrogenase